MRFRATYRFRHPGGQITKETDTFSKSEGSLTMDEVRAAVDASHGAGACVQVLSISVIEPEDGDTPTVPWSPTGHAA